MADATPLTVAVLATFHPTQRRRGKHAGPAKTMYWTWYEPAWLKERLESAAIGAYDMLSVLDACYIVGLVLVSPGAVWQQDMLQLWGIEADFLWRSCSRMPVQLHANLGCEVLGAFTDVVCGKQDADIINSANQNGFRLEVPLQVRFQGSRKGSAGLSALHSAIKSMVFRLIHEDAHRLSGARLADGRTVAEYLASMNVAIQELVCVRQPVSISLLIVQRKWSELVLLPTCYVGRPRAGRDSRLPPPQSMEYDLVCAGYPKQDWILQVWHLRSEAQQGLALHAQTRPRLTADCLDHLLAFLRRSGACADISDDSRRDLQGCITVVDRLAKPYRDAIMAKTKHYHMRYTAEQLLHAFIATRQAGSLDHAALAVEHVIELLLPGMYQEVSSCMPSAATLRRAKTRVDMALVRMSQLENMGSRGVMCWRYGWSDASPISGRDYFLSKHISITAHKAKLAYICARMLALDTEEKVKQTLQMLSDSAPQTHTSRNRFQNDLEDAEGDATLSADVQETVPQLTSLQRQKLAAFIDDSVCQHVHVPCTVASGYASLQHKAACLVHQVAVECMSEADLLNWFASVRSWTTDNGAEAGLAQCYIPSTRLLPEWWAWESPLQQCHDGASEDETQDNPPLQQCHDGASEDETQDNPPTPHLQRALAHDGEDDDGDASGSVANTSRHTLQRDGEESEEMFTQPTQPAQLHTQDHT
eukprot:4344855-Amphidinium_carterae.2